MNPSVVTLEDALVECGWETDPHAPGCYRLQAKGSWARLQRTSLRHGWVTLAGEVEQKAQSPLVLNAGIPGPWKFVSLPDGSTRLRVDFPRLLEAVPHDDSPFTFSLNHTFDRPAVCEWARDLTAWLAGSPKPDAATGPFSAADIAAELDRRGWPATAEGDQVRLTVALPRVFRDALLQRTETGGARLRATLADLTGATQLSPRAALSLALEANNRLCLVRFSAVGEPGSESLIAEVHLGRARIPGPLLDAALESLRTAVGLCARELAALQNPGLAQLVLAANAAA
jgi:hypothetical protein